MKLAILSDIHGNLAALEAVCADMRARGVEQVVNLGDSLSGPLLPLETARFLMAAGWPCLAGNHERQLLALSAGDPATSDGYAYLQLGSGELAWLRSLPSSLLLSEGVCLCHGSPRSDVEYFLDSVAHGGTRLATAEEVAVRMGTARAAVIACGHTHIPRSMRSPEGVWMVNPGSVGLPAYADTHPEPHVVETGSPDARYAILERAQEEWKVSLMSVPYDFESMASLAAVHGRADWAYALRTGYMR